MLFDYGVAGVTVRVGVAVGIGVAMFAGTLSNSPIIRLVVSVNKGVMLFAERYRLVSAMIWARRAISVSLSNDLGNS